MKKNNKIILTFLVSVFSQYIGADVASAQYATNLWPNGIVPYEIDSNVQDYYHETLRDAMEKWENVANVVFKPRAGESDYVHIRSSLDDDNPINQSQVGIQGGKQVIHIKGWGNPFVIAHELGHALGMYHTMTRKDREAYIEIKWEIVEGGTDNEDFKIHSSAIDYPKQDYGLSGDKTYDFDSVMHYNRFGGCIDDCPGPTIIVLPPNEAWQTEIGQATHLSDLDKLSMSFLYPESDWRFVDQTYSGWWETGSFIWPYKTFNEGMDQIAEGGTLWVQPGVYIETGTFDKAMTLRAPLGHVTIGSSSALTYEPRQIANSPSSNSKNQEVTKNGDQTLDQYPKNSSTNLVPAVHALSQNYPNPFNPETMIGYQLPQAGEVTLRVYNLLGKEVVVLRDDYTGAGYHQMRWNGRDKFGQKVASGVYIYRLEVKARDGQQFVATRRMNLLR